VKITLRKSQEISEEEAEKLAKMAMKMKEDSDKE
jgi:hypothetical protein